MNAAIYAHSDHPSESAAQAVAAEINGAAVKYHKRRDRWDVLTPAPDDGFNIISFDALPRSTELATVSSDEPTPAAKRAAERQELWDALKVEAAALANKTIAEALASGVARSDDWLDAPTDSAIRIIEAGEFAGGEYVEPDWLIEELIPARGIGLAWGLSGSHKTGGVFDLMAATHRGTPWRDKTVKRGRSVMVVGEGEYFFGARLRAYAKDRGIDVADLPAVVPSPVNLRDGKQVAAFALELLKLGAAQVWFDTLQQCSPGADENSVRDMGEVITNLKTLSRKVGCFAGVIHHAGKNVDKGARGSSAWRPAVDVEVYFESPDGINGTMRVEKLKDAAPNSVYPFERRVIELGMRSNGKPITSVVVVQSDDAPFVKGVAKLPKPGTLARAIYDAARAPIEEPELRASIVESMAEPDAGEKDKRGSRVGEKLNELLRLQLLFRLPGKMISTTQLVQGGADEKDF